MCKPCLRIDYSWAHVAPPVLMVQVTCLAFIAYVGLPALTGYLTRNLRAGPEQWWQFYRKVVLKTGGIMPGRITV